VVKPGRTCSRQLSASHVGTRRPGGTILQINFTRTKGHESPRPMAQGNCPAVHEIGEMLRAMCATPFRNDGYPQSTPRRGLPILPGTIDSCQGLQVSTEESLQELGEAKRCSLDALGAYLRLHMAEMKFSRVSAILQQDIGPESAEVHKSRCSIQGEAVDLINLSLDCRRLSRQGARHWSLFR
jgi:hypothetical protein